MNPGDIINHQLFFNNFTNKTTLILINGGVLSKNKYESDDKKYYVGYNNNYEQGLKSSSGGAFSAIASYFLNDLRGVVYGASMIYENSTLECKNW